MSVWKPIPHIPGYEASGDGQIRCAVRGQGRRFGRTLTPRKTNNGYWEVRVWTDGKSKNFHVHRAVCAAFHGPCPDGMQVRHLDGNKDNNAWDNLRYGTPKENGEDNVRLGAMQRGEDRPQAKLSQEQAQAAVNWLAEGQSATAIALLLEVPRNAIYHIKYGRAWAWLKPESANNRNMDRAAQ